MVQVNEKKRGGSGVKLQTQYCQGLLQTDGWLCFAVHTPWVRPEGAASWQGGGVVSHQRLDGQPEPSGQETDTADGGYGTQPPDVQSGEEVK